MLQKSTIHVLPQSALCVYFLQVYMFVDTALPSEKWELNTKLGATNNKLLDKS